MRLSSARELKLELASEVSGIGMGRHKDLRRILSFSATAAIEASTAYRHSGLALEALISATTRTVPQGVAVGIVPVEGNSPERFRLAIRLQSNDPAASAWAHYAAGRAKGEADLRYVGKVRAFAANYRAKRRPLSPGWSVGAVETGTIGFFAHDTRSQVVLVSNSHVLAGSGPILQPGPLDKGKKPTHVVAKVGRLALLTNTGINRIDAGYAHVAADIPVDMTWDGALLNGVVAEDELVERRSVWKVGRTTGKTSGKITAIEVDQISADYSGKLLRFDGQIEIEGDDNKPFALPGDSGAAVLNKKNEGVGMIFSGSSDGAVSYANPMEGVLSRLKVSVP